MMLHQRQDECLLASLCWLAAGSPEEATRLYKRETAFWDRLADGWPLANRTSLHKKNNSRVLREFIRSYARIRLGLSLDRAMTLHWFNAAVMPTGTGKVRRRHEHLVVARWHERRPVKKWFAHALVYDSLLNLILDPATGTDYPVKDWVRAYTDDDIDCLCLNGVVVYRK